MDAAKRIEALLNKKYSEREDIERQLALVNAEISGLDQAMQAIRAVADVQAGMSRILEDQARS